MSDDSQTTKDDKKNAENVFSAVNTVTDQLETIEKFIARRFDEISMEINATAQQVDMAEDGMVNKFAEILEILGAISFKGSGESAANTGVELEAVIEDTEGAANKILDAADRISSYVADDADWSDQATRQEIREKIKSDVQEILLACTFQDLTGQRIRNTLNNLHQIENRLSSTFEKLGIEVEVDDKAVAEKVGKAANQSEVDALLKGFEAGEQAKSDNQDKASNE